MYLILQKPLNITDYHYGIRLNSTMDGKVLITFNARNDHDRQKFVEDLKEAILEVCPLEVMLYIF